MRQQLFLLRRIDTIEAGIGGRRAGDAHMHLGRPGIAHHLDDLLRGGAAHDGIIHQHHALALDLHAVGVVLALHVIVADLVGRLDEGTPDIMVADDPQLEGQARFRGIADGGRHAGIRHRHDDIGINMALARQLHADILARLIDRLAFDIAVGPREIDVLEHAEALAPRREGPVAGHPLAIQHDDLARLHIAHEFRADDVESTGFRGQDMGVAQLAQHQRPHAVGIAHADHPLGSEGNQRIGALDLPQRIDQPVQHGRPLRGGDQMDDDLGIGGGLEQAAALHQLAAQLQRVGQIAVMADGQPAELEIREQRLHVAQQRLAGGRITIVADGGMAFQPRHHIGRDEDFRHMAKPAMGIKALAVEGNDPAGLLSPMLQRVQPQGRMRGGILRAEDAEDRAFLAQVIVVFGFRRFGHVERVGGDHRILPGLRCAPSRAPGTVEYCHRTATAFSGSTDPCPAVRRSYTPMTGTVHRLSVPRLSVLRALPAD